MSDSKVPVILFMHQMKTGGVSLNHVFRHQYNSQVIFHIDGRNYRQSIEMYKNLSLPEKLKYKIISGHMFFGLHHSVPGPCKYITMLRNPIERVVSLYFYQRRPQHKFKISNNMSLIEYLEEGVAMNADNGMTRFISGMDLKDMPYGQCTQEMLSDAKTNIKQHFLLVGLTDKFDETLFTLQRLLMWKNQGPHPKKNINPQKPSQHSLTDKELATIKKYNQLDIQLYKFIKSQFRE